MPKPMLPVALLAAAVISWGCGEKPPKPATAPAPNVVTFEAVDYGFSGPGNTPAGVTTLRLVNHGKDLHHLILIRLDDGKTLADLMALKPTDAPPTWAKEVGGPNAAEPGGEASATLTLEPGRYAMVCFIPTVEGIPHVVKGMAATLEVGPATGSAAAEPEADVVLTLVDYNFGFSTPLTAGPHVIRIENTGAQVHEVILLRLEPGKSVQDFLAWVEKRQGPPPAHLMSGMGALQPGRHASFSGDFTPGDYGLVCFVPDLKDGKPHFVHGMIQQFKVQ
ncbi:MAG: hypothetical protein ACREMO_00650 [Gemmatimonadales bacterium]